MNDALLDVWAAVHAERHALIADLEPLTAQQWDKPSLAAGWSVHDVAAHLVDNALKKPWGLLTAMARPLRRRPTERERHRRSSGRDPGAHAGAPAGGRRPDERAPDRLAALESRLVEEIAHGEDIRRAVHLTRAYPPAALAAAIGYQARTPAATGGAASVAKQVTLVADDADLRLGSGPELRGPALALLMLLTGRRHALTDLSGPGLALVSPAKA